jgi:CBS-domain-containing membrane protein
VRQPIFAAKISSQAEETQTLTRHSMAGVRVADVMTAHPHTAPAWITVENFIEDYLLRDRHSAYPVEDRDGSILGLITLAQLRGVSGSQRQTTLIREIAIPLFRVTTASPDEPVTALLERLTPEGVTAHLSSIQALWSALSPRATSHD